MTLRLLRMNRIAASTKVRRNWATPYSLPLIQKCYSRSSFSPLGFAHAMTSASRIPRKSQIALLLLSSILPWLILEAPDAAAAVRNTRTGEVFTSIQSAINDSGTLNGDEIVADPGTYTENINISKKITLRGNAPAMIQAANANNHVVQINADNVKLIGFSVTGATARWWVDEELHGYGGIKVQAVTNVVISNNKVFDNLVGIGLVAGASNNLIEMNEIYNNFALGIALDDASNNNEISNNTVHSNGHEIDKGTQGSGIHLYDLSSNNKITANTIRDNNEAGIRFDGDSSSNEVSGNAITGNKWGIWSDPHN